MPDTFHLRHTVAFSEEAAAEILRQLPESPGVLALRGAEDATQPYLTKAANLRRDAASGNLAAEANDLDAAKYLTPDATTGGISMAYLRHDSQGIASYQLENAANIAHYLASQGVSAADANSQALAFTINSDVDHSGNTVVTAQTQTNQITDLATSLAKSVDLTQSEAIPTTASSLFNILEGLSNATASTTDHKLAYERNNQVLASFDALYGSGSPNNNESLQTALAVSDYA